MGRLDADHITAQQAHKVGQDREQGQGEDCGVQARRHQFAHGISAERAHGVNLLADQHGADLRGNAGAVSPRHHQRRQHRSQLPDHGQGYGLTHHADLPEGLERPISLQRQHCPRENARQQDDGQRAETDGVHLKQGVHNVAGRGEEGADRIRKEVYKVLDGQHRTFGETLAQNVCLVGRQSNRQHLAPEVSIAVPRTRCKNANEMLPTRESNQCADLKSSDVDRPLTPGTRAKRRRANVRRMDIKARW